MTDAEFAALHDFLKSVSDFESFIEDICKRVADSFLSDPAFDLKEV